MSNKKEKVNNPVAKFANEFNKPNVHVDRKKNRDRGYEKHKGKYNVFKRKPRAVSEILGAFLAVVDELDQRVAQDEADISRAKEQIEELNSDIAQATESKNSAISVRSRIKALIGV